MGGQRMNARRTSWAINRLWRAPSVIRDVLLDAGEMVSQSSFARMHRLVRPYTVLGHARLLALHRAVRQVVERRIPGEIVECGTARGGSAALLALTLKDLGADRRVWVFDTFEGLPTPTARDRDATEAWHYAGTHRGDLFSVQELFERLGILGQCRFIKGLFKDTLAGSGIGAIAVLHIDCDWYESVRVCLEQLYDRVSPGGIIQIDDYGHWAGARTAVEEFLLGRAPDACLRWVDYTGRQLIKSAGPPS